MTDWKFKNQNKTVLSHGKNEKHRPTEHWVGQGQGAQDSSSSSTRGLVPETTVREAGGAL